MKPNRSTHANPQRFSRSVRDLNPDLYREVWEAIPALHETANTLPSTKPKPGHGGGNAVQKLLRRRRRVMNRTEAEYARILDAQQSRGEIVSYDFEGCTLRWGNDEVFSYTSDFLVVQNIVTESASEKPYVRLIFIEVKGAHIRQKDWDRFRHARDNWPLYEFRLFQKTKEGWVRRA